MRQSIMTELQGVFSGMRSATIVEDGQGFTCRMRFHRTNGFHDIDNRLGGSEKPGLAGLLEMVREFVFINLIDGRMMKTDD